jgi:hypothetical protein
MTFFDKVKWTLGILMIFVIIITTNLIDRSNFQRVRDAAVNIYEDRLVAKDLLYDISTAINEKEVAAVRKDSIFFADKNNTINKTIEDLTLRFEDTEFTTSERKIFMALREDLTKLGEQENIFTQSGLNKSDGLFISISTIKTHLNSLSDIQLSEAKREVTNTRKAVNTVELFTQIEIYVLVFLAILIQIIILYNPKDSI